MMTFNFPESASNDQRKEAQDVFFKYIKDLKEYFDENDVAVNVDMKKKAIDRYLLTSAKDNMLADIMALFQQYKKANPQ